MMTELMPATAHDPFVARGCCEEASPPKRLPLHAGMSAKEVAQAVLELAARRDIAGTRLW